MKNQIFEWVVKTTDDTYFLTEKQYNYLLDNQDKRFVVFDTVSINPAYVTSMERREAIEIIKKYPCSKCGMRGFLVLGVEKDEQGNWPLCPHCNGTGVDNTK